MKRNCSIKNDISRKNKRNTFQHDTDSFMKQKTKEAKIKYLIKLPVKSISSFLSIPLK